MELVWHGTAAVEVRGEQGRLLFDPFVPLKHSPVPVSIGDFDGFSDIFITHGHFDHISSLPEEKFSEKEAIYYRLRTDQEQLMPDN